MSIRLHGTARPRIIRALVAANSLLGLTGILLFLLYFLPHRAPTEIVIGQSSEPFDSFWAVAFLTGGGIHFVVAYGLFRARQWSRLFQKIVATPYLLAFPLGTLYALMTYIGLNRMEVDRYFREARSEVSSMPA